LQMRPWMLWSEPALMALCHARLHRLPSSGFPSFEGSLLCRSLEAIAATIRTLGLIGLKQGHEWLVNHRPESWSQVAILHLDFHPMNLIYDENGQLAVLDWTEADLGDPHADVATTLMLMETVQVGRETVLGRSLTGVGRGILRRRYLRA